MDPFREGFGLLLPQKERQALWGQLSALMESHLGEVARLPVAPSDQSAALSAYLKTQDFQAPQRSASVVAQVGTLLKEGLLHTSHPAYFGVFNPSPSTMGVAADLLVASFNPQLASTASAKVCIEMENHLVRYFGMKFGYPSGSVRGCFTTGGTEANYTAVLCALAAKLPDFRTDGVGTYRPVLYTSKETHHSFLRAARVCGLGTKSVVELPVDARLQLDVAALDKQISIDKAAGKLPLFVVATLGSTSAGVFDALDPIAEVAKRHGLWLHADAAWGGAAILLPEHRALFAGVEKTDSLTLDAHKWLSVPMGAGIFFTPHANILEETFSVEASHYMPPGTHAAEYAEPYKQSLQWSRRFTGLKLFLTLAVHGEEGYQKVLRHQIEMGGYLREKLEVNGWKVVNETALPVVCFVDPKQPSLDVKTFAKRVGETGKTWITPTKLYHTGQDVLRAGISNFATQKEHVDTLVAVLNQLR